MSEYSEPQADLIDDLQAKVYSREIENAELKIKIKRLEDFTRATGHEDYSASLEKTQEGLDSLYSGELDEGIAKSIKECKEEWS